MNKIYKLVWSKTRNMYIAVCEFAKSHTKSQATGVLPRTLIAGFLAYVLSCGAVIPVWAADKDTVTSAAANTTKLYLLGHTAAGTAQVKYDTGIYATTTAGELYVTSLQTSKIGAKARFFDENNTEINSSNGTILFGDYTGAHNAGYAVAIGLCANVNAQGSVAVGVNAFTKSTATESVAIGSESVASEAYTVSFGHVIGDPISYNAYGDEPTYFESNVYRRLVNVADGTDDHDVSTVGQMHTYTTPADNGNYVAGFSTS